MQCLLAWPGCLEVCVCVCVCLPRTQWWRNRKEVKQSGNTSPRHHGRARDPSATVCCCCCWQTDTADRTAIARCGLPESRSSGWWWWWRRAATANMSVFNPQLLASSTRNNDAPINVAATLATGQIPDSLPPTPRCWRTSASRNDRRPSLPPATHCYTQHYSLYQMTEIKSNYLHKLSN